MESGALVCKRLKRTHSSLCAAANCKNSRVKRPDLSFFKFPNDLDRAQRWAINICRDDLVHQKPEYLNRNRTVCSEHFETIMFLNDLRNRLHSHAIPTIVNVSNPPKTVTVSRPLACRQQAAIPTIVRTIVNVSNPPKTVTVSRPLPCRQQAVVAVEWQPSMKEEKILEIKRENYELDEKPVDTSGPIETLDITIQHRPGSSTSTSDVAHRLIQTPMVLKTDEGENYELDEKPVDTSGPIETSLDVAIQHRPGSSTSTFNVAHKSIQTPMMLLSKSPRNTMLKKKIHSLQVLVSRRKKRLELVKKQLVLLKKRYCSRNIDDSVESIVKAASNFLSGDCLSWLEIQLRMGKRSPKGRRYSDYAKHFALNLYSHGPKVYSILSNIFTLPSKSTLSSWSEQSCCQDLKPQNQDLEPQDQDLEPQDQDLEPQDQDLEHQDQDLEPQDQDFERQDQDLEHQDLEPQDQDLEPQDQDLEPQDQDPKNRN